MVGSDWEQTLNGLEKSLQEDPRDTATCRRLADAYAVRGRLRDTVSTYLHLSDLLQSQGDYENALQISGLVLQLQPESEKGRLQRIHLFEQRQDVAQASKAYRELSLLYVEQGRGQQAIELLERARRGQPDNLELMLELAETHTAEGQLNQAMNLFAQAAEGFLMRGHRERACDCLRRLKVLNSANVSVLLQLGKLYLELDRLGESEQELRGVLRQTLNHEEALMLLGQVCQRKGQGRDACLAFQRLISLNPESWEAHEHLAQVQQSQGLPFEAGQNYLRAAEGYLALGERERAVRPLRNLLAIEPDHPGAVSHLATLNAPVQPLELEMPALEPAVTAPSTPSGELRQALKRRELTANKPVLKPLPGSQPQPKVSSMKPVLVKLAVVEELPDFEGSNDWLSEDLEIADCAWLAALPLFSSNWTTLQHLVCGDAPARLSWPGQIWVRPRFAKLSEELEHWSQVCRQTPELWQPRSRWAETCMKAGLYEQAIELYREVVEVAPDNDEMRHQLIQALIWNDDLTGAAEACLGLADLYRGRGEDAESLESIQLLLQLEPQHLGARRRLSDWTEGKVSRHHLSVLAELAFAQESWEEALRAGSELLAADENQWQIRRRVQYAAERCGRDGEALTHARRLLEQFCQMGDWQQASLSCEDLAAREAGHLRLLVKLLEKCDQPERLAAAKIRLAQELIDTDQREQALVLLAECAVQDRAAAETLLELLLVDGDARVSALGARILEENLRMGEWEQAEALCLRLLQAFPEAPELRFALGEIHRQAGRWEAALEQFQQARRHQGWLHKATHSLALCLKQREGMTEVANRQIEKALQVQGKAEELEALRNLLSA
ncbi:hypothetical protein ABS71_09580 [bacterium SCN 62-11]|nr:MAG: hypothetical protein ABS71_09580 [bacterium SCN 62-11]